MSKNNYMVILSILSIILIIVFISGCVNTGKDTTHDKKIIITTIVTVSYFAKRIAGDKAEIVSMVPPGASPHSYEPTPGQLKTVSKADLFIKVGSGIEFELEWADKIIEMNRKMAVVDCSSNIELVDVAGNDSYKDEGLLDREDSGTDPHIWLSPVNAVVIARNIYDGILEIDPDNEKYYYENLEALQAELDTLDDNIRKILSGLENKKILVFHPAWTYFVHEYGLEQIAVEEEGKEPTVKSMEVLIDQAKEQNIKVIFASPEFDIKSAEVIASEIDGELVLVSPLPLDYISDMEKIARVFKNSIK